MKVTEVKEYDLIGKIVKIYFLKGENIVMKDTNDVYAENITRIQEPGYLGVAYDLKGKQEYNVHVDLLRVIFTDRC